jgi:hypothetical protein
LPEEKRELQYPSRFLVREIWINILTLDSNELSTVMRFLVRLNGIIKKDHLLNNLSKRPPLDGDRLYQMTRGIGSRYLPPGPLGGIPPIYIPLVVYFEFLRVNFETKMCTSKNKIHYKCDLDGLPLGTLASYHQNCQFKGNDTYGWREHSHATHQAIAALTPAFSIAIIFQRPNLAASIAVRAKRNLT